MIDIRENQQNLKTIDRYLQSGGRIEKRRNLIVLIDKDGDYIVGGETFTKLLKRCKLFAIPPPP